MKRTLTLTLLAGLAMQSPADAGQYLTCNSCGLAGMGAAAQSYGSGDHLVIDVPGRTGIIVTVTCGGPMDGPAPSGTKLESRAPASTSAQPRPNSFGSGCIAADYRWSPQDQQTLDFLIDGMQYNGQWSKDIEIEYPYDSIYDIARNPDYNLGPIVDSLGLRVMTYTPFSASWGGLVSWAQSFSNVSSSGEIRVIIVFPDGTIHARISMSWLGHAMQPTIGDITILRYTSRDSEGNNVPNLTGGANLDGASFHFWNSGTNPPSPPIEWRELVEGLGYSVGTSSGGGTWGCVTIGSTEEGDVIKECNES